MTGGRQVPSRSHCGQIHAVGIAADLPHGVAHVLPTRVRRRTNSMNGPWAEIAAFTRIKDHIRIHEQRLIALGKVDPEVISIGPRGLVPYPEVTVIGIVDVHFAGRMAAATESA